MKLYHISENPDIKVFEPRLTKRSDREGKRYVWAIREEKLPNYLFPRDCPRIAFFVQPTSSPQDIARLLAGTTAKIVLAIEKKWLPILLQTTLYQYEMSPTNFQLDDEIAGYYVSEHTELPINVTIIDDMLSALLQYDIELRIVPSLWQLHQEVIHSTLGFSIIRIRNAAPPAETGTHF